MRDNTIKIARRGFLASVAAFLGLGAAGKSGRTTAKGFPVGVQPLAASMPQIGDPYPYSDDERKGIWVMRLDSQGNVMPIPPGIVELNRVLPRRGNRYEQDFY